MIIVEQTISVPILSLHLILLINGKLRKFIYQIHSAINENKTKPSV